MKSIESKLSPLITNENEETNATVILQPTSGKSNCYGGAKSFELPNSKITV